MRIATPAAAVVALLALTLSACATPRDDAPAAPVPPRLGDVRPAPPAGEVLAQGTVMDKAGDISLCTGAIAQSYPPQCAGIPLDEWDWSAVDGHETAGDSTWGAYAVTGRFDGERIAVTAPPMMLALFDPPASPDPTGGTPGAGDEERLEQIQQTATERLGEELQVSWIEDGYLRLQVLWDDGTYQAAADAEFGQDMVIIESMLTPVD